jgi:hypothetical protein
MKLQEGGCGVAGKYRDFAGIWSRGDAKQQADHQIAPKQPGELLGKFGRTPREQPGRQGLGQIMPAEIRATVPLYLDGKIQQWFTRGDGRGVIFILNCKDVAEARALIESLPLSKENLMDEQFIPVGPLLPLSILLRDSPRNK